MKGKEEEESLGEGKERSEKLKSPENKVFQHYSPTRLCCKQWFSAYSPGCHLKTCSGSTRHKGILPHLCIKVLKF